MLRLYIRFYIALLASLVLFAVAAMTVTHLMGGPWTRAGAYPHPFARHFSIVLSLLALSIGLAAYPLVRHISRRLERLQRAVESLGAGDLSARVPVEGRDEVAQLASSFNRSAAQIERLVQANKAALANASHELRTPLARIRLAVELMKESADAKRRAGLEQDIAELDWLVDEILLASRLDTVTESIDTQDVDLLALAAEECARYDATRLAGTPCVIRGDARLLRRLLRNLLENAARHGLPPTQVQISRSPSAATITVWDGGGGVSPGEFENIFRPFYRPADGQPRSGTGLGLSLVRQIAHRHGGDARCDLRPDGRSCFVITLPVERGATDHFPGRPESPDGKALQAQ
jgi:two-component system, OmpR family, sensor histidine kinase RstB